MKRPTKRNPLNHQRPRRASAGLRSVVTLVALLSAATSVRSQTTGIPVDGMVRPLDAYGNVRGIRPDRRALDVYQNEVQRDVLTGYLNVNRRPDQFGRGSPFALPGDLLATALDRYTGAVFLRSLRPRTSSFGGSDRERREAFEQYGGFGDRRANRESDDPSGLLTRRRELILATGLNAPIERAMSRGGAHSLMRWSVGRTPFLEAQQSGLDSLEHQPTDAPVALDDRLASRADLFYAKARQEGWASFRDADYRRAGRYFETASLLDPEDGESRIGEIFSHLSMDGVHTAFTLLQEFDRKEPNLFLYDMNVADQYAEAGTPLRLRLSAQSVAESSGHSIETTALFTFVLWYLDRRDDALRSARSLATRAPDRTFAAWPEKMTAAITARSMRIRD